MPLLSICIPTYNRKKCLQQCIDSIVEQSVFSELEIVVSDNGSNDGTEEMMSGYVAKYPNIVYSRNPENLWFDRNVLKVVSLANGKYCCFIGDDDAFFPEAITGVIDALSQETAEYFITNNWGYDISLLEPVMLRPNMSIEENTRYNTLKEFVHSLQPDRIKTVGFFWGMSWQIFLKSKWDACNEKETFIGTQTIHLFVLLHSMIESPFMIIALPTIKTRADNIRWDTFHMTNWWKREKTTLDAFVYIAKIYVIPYRSIPLYIQFILSYIKNTSILYIKKYILKDQKTIMSLKRTLSKFSPFI